MAQRENKVIYKVFKLNSSGQFFRCLASLFSKFVSKEFDITYGRLRNYGLFEKSIRNTK